MHTFVGCLATTITIDNHNNNINWIQVAVDYTTVNNITNKTQRPLKYSESKGDSDPSNILNQKGHKDLSNSQKVNLHKIVLSI